MWSQWRGRFEYPPACQLSNFVADSCTIDNSTSEYQLIGWVLTVLYHQWRSGKLISDVSKLSLIVLEEVQPVAKWLLYLRPRRGQDRWLLFFNDAVTFAREREVFEDSFGGDEVPPGTPLRVPYVFVYA